MKVFINIVFIFIIYTSTSYSGEPLYLVRVSKEISESSVLKKVKSDDTHNYYEVSEDELKIINEARTYERTHRYKKRNNINLQNKVNSQFGITD